MEPDESRNGLTFEQAFTRLEEVVRQLEGGQPSLDRAIELYEEGMKLSRHCDAMLQRAQLRVSKLHSDMNSSGQPGHVSSGASPMRDSGAGSSSSASDGAGGLDDDRLNLPW